MTDVEIQQFRAELKALLTKYNASICCSVGSYSDTDDLYNKKMTIWHTVPGTFKDINILEIDSWVIRSGDIV